MHVPIFFQGVSGWEDRVTVTTVSNSLILGGWVTKVLKNGDKNGGGGGVGGGRVDDNNILTFCSTVVNKKCHVPVYFYTRLPIH